MKFRNTSSLLAASAGAACLILGLSDAKAATLFKDDFEAQTVGIPPVKAQVGTYSTSGEPGSVTNAAPPGGHSGTNYGVLRREPGNVPLNTLRGRFPGNVPNNGVVHFEAWMWLELPSIVQIGLDATSDSFASIVTFYSTINEIHVYDGSAHVNSGITFTPGEWMKCELDYTVGSTNVTLTVNSNSAVMRMPAVSTVQGIWFYSGGPGTLFYVDDVLAQGTLPPTGDPVFADGIELATLIGAGPIGPPQVGSYVPPSPPTYPLPVAVNEVVPGPHSGTNYALSTRVASPTSINTLTPMFTETNVTDITHFEFWLIAVSNSLQFQFGLDSTADAYALTFTLWNDNTVKIYDGTMHQNTGLSFTPGVWEKYEIDYTPGASEATFTVGGISAVVPVPPVPDVRGAWTWESAAGVTHYLDDLQAEIRTPTGTNVVFSDGFEANTIAPGGLPGPALIGTYVPPEPPLTSGLVTNATQPVAFAGTNSLSMTRGSGDVPFGSLRGRFSKSAVSIGDEVHLGAHFLIQSGSGQFGLDSPANGFATAITLGADRKVSVNNGTTDVFSGLTYTTNAWQRFELTYTNGANNILLTVNGTNAVMSVAAVPSVQGFWFSSGQPGTVWNADEVFSDVISVPRLNISQTGNQAILSWSVFAEGYVLQENSNFPNPASWLYVAGGSNSPVSVPIGAGNEFFRLKK